MSHKHALIGVALAEPAYPTTLAMVEQTIETDRHGRRQTIDLQQRHLEQVPPGTALQKIVERAEALAATAGHVDRTSLGPTLLVDVTVMGMTVLDLFSHRRPTAVTMTLGGVENETGRDQWSVPRREIIGALLTSLQAGRLRTAANLPLATAFADALKGFAMRPLRAEEDPLDAVRAHGADGLVIAAGLCVWRAAKVRPAVTGGLKPVIAFTGFNPLAR